MTRSELLKRILLIKKYPDAMPPLSNKEMVDLVEAFLQLTNQTRALEHAVKNGALKGDAGKTPEADKEYLSLATSKRMIEEALNRYVGDVDAKLGNRADTLEKRVSERLTALRDGNDATVTDAEIERAAQLARDLIELPDFEALISERLTANPEAIRDALELIDEEGNKLEQSAIKNLPRDLEEIRNHVAGQRVGGGASVNKVVSIFNEKIPVSVLPPPNAELNQLWVDIS